jgi:hypothetical protein
VSNVVLITRGRDDGATWSRPEVLFSHDARGVWATEFFIAGGRPCIFVHTYNPECRYHEVHAYRSFSDDNGRTWSEPCSVPRGMTSICVRRGTLLQDGTWVFPVYWEEVRGNWDWTRASSATWQGLSMQFPGSGLNPTCCGVLRSQDGGESFSLHGNIRADHSLMEGNAVEVAPNHLVMLMRAQGRGVLFRADSTDGGRTWSPPGRTDIPDPSSKIDLTRIGDSIVLLHNPNPMQGWEARIPLSLSVSHDECETWERRIDLVTSRQKGAVMCYPHSLADYDRQILYVACENARQHVLLKVPFADFL